VTDEKGLPMIIVTPSSPTHEREFFLAWVPPPPPPPSALQRLFARLRRGRAPALPPTPTTAGPPKAGVTLRWRTVLLLALLFFILVSHVLTHGLDARRPRLFMHQSSADIVPVAGTAAPSTAASGGIGKLIGFEWLFAEEEVEERDFVVEALGEAARRR
jgi:hypothetical protein